jgi:hypothetical protein
VRGFGVEMELHLLVAFIGKPTMRHQLAGARDECMHGLP